MVQIFQDMQIDKGVKESPLYEQPEYIQWSIIRPIEQESLDDRDKRKSLLMSGTTQQQPQKSIAIITEDTESSELQQQQQNGPPPTQKPRTNSNIQVLESALAPPFNPNEESMRLKRTTVLSGNFAKKSALAGGRDRAASENV